MKTDHVKGIDALRFLAAAAVSLFHLAFWVWAFPGGMSARAAQGAVPADSFPPMLAAWGFIGVQVFFVISGFVIAYSAAGATPRRFFASRVARLAPAVWVIGSIGAVVALATGGFGSGEVARAWAKSVALWPYGPWIDSVYWTLGVEICFYALVWALLAVGRGGWVYRVMLAIGTLSVVFWGCWLVAPHGAMTRVSTARWLDLTLVHHGCLFAIGVWTHRRFVLKESASPIWPALFAVGALLQINHEAESIASKTASGSLAIVACVAWLGAMLLFWCAVTGKAFMNALPDRMSRTLGLATYPLYLIHNVIGGAVMGWMILAGMPVPTALAATLAVAIGGSVFVAKVIEPPIAAWIKGRLA